ncbi:6-phosphogluconolactonase [Ferruginibacter sp.]|uniref:6-phosphogluconolactonase n=1 Tax=Ferruginibacter sp. TaxID=1940288 RepID=UPI00265946F7|nr:6-phosphogluconolactonase [Ferruginibacter sp.]
MKINIFKTEAEVLDGLAKYFVAIANEAIDKYEQFSVALSGGNSPKKLYGLLSSPVYKNMVQWSKVYFFFGDERYVPLTDVESNYGMAKKALFEPLQVNAANIFAVDTLLPPAIAAAQYAATLHSYFAGGDMKFDLILLGLGDNAHTASLFPFTTVLQDESVSVKAVFLTDVKKYRITFTAPLINKANNIAFLVYGQGKAAAVKNVIENEPDIENFPAQLIAPPNGTLQWFMDEEAASSLKYQ